LGFKDMTIIKKGKDILEFVCGMLFNIFDMQWHKFLFTCQLETQVSQNILMRILNTPDLYF